MEFNYNASVDSEYEAQLFGFSGTSVVSGRKFWFPLFILKLGNFQVSSLKLK